MKKMIILVNLLALGAVISCAQEQNCNRTVRIHSTAERLPKDICLPEGYFIWSILADTVDINGDGTTDFAARLQKIAAQDGDTTLVVLYRQDKHGHFEEWTTFDNLFPVYLKDYDYDYYRDFKTNKDTSYFMKLRARYAYPELSKVFFAKDTITVKFNTDGGGGLLMHFVLNEAQNDWHLKKQVEWAGSWGEIEKIPNYGVIIPKDQYSIRAFNMLDYLDDIRWE
jgi:hypothetical protein